MLATYVTHTEFARGFHTSGPLFILWSSLTLCGYEITVCKYITHINMVLLPSYPIFRQIFCNSDSSILWVHHMHYNFYGISAICSQLRGQSILGCVMTDYNWDIFTVAGYIKGRVFFCKLLPLLCLGIGAVPVFILLRPTGSSVFANREWWRGKRMFGWWKEGYWNGTGFLY